MKIIILGGNQVGGTLAENLVNEQHDVTVVDTDQEKLTRLQARLDLNTLCGSASYPSVLKQAGADDADMLIAVTNNDEVNLVACQVAYSLFHLPTKIARIRSPEYFKFPNLFGKDDLPVDVFISPEQLVTRYIERLIEHPGALQVLDFADGKVKLVAIRPFFGGPLVGKTIEKCREELNIEFRVVAIYRRNQAILPEGDTVIEIGDELFFITAEKNIKKVMGALRRLDQPYKRIMLAGAGNVGSSLVKALEHRYEVKVIEADPIKAEQIAVEASRATILQGDVSDRELLFNENIEKTDVFCAVTDDDEANIMSCMLAKNLGVRTVMALIKRTIYVDLIESSSIDVAISPQQATISSILKYVRRGDIINVHSLRRGAAEAIEIVAHGDEGTSRVIGRAIKDIKLPQGVMIGAIVRDDKVLMGRKELLIEPEDRVILFLVDRKKVRDIEKLFQVSIGFFG
jgi:trk system potassium uptake protein